MNGDLLRRAAVFILSTVISVAVVSGAVGVWTLRDDVREIKHDLKKIISPMLRDHEVRLRDLEDGRQATP